MTFINPPRLANRTGRIVLATILASAVVGVLSLFNPENATQLTAVSDGPGIYFDALFDVSITTVFLSLVVPPAVLAYWGLSSKLSERRTWLVLAVVTVGVAVAWAVGDVTGALDIVLATVAKTIKGGAILLSIAAVETITSGESDLAPGQLATGVGALALVFVVVVPIAALGAGVVSDTGDEPERDGAEAAFNSSGEPYPDYTHLTPEQRSIGEPDSADHLVVNTSEQPPNLTDRHSYTVTETHVGGEYFDLRELQVHTNESTTAVQGHYDLTFEVGDNRSPYYDSVVNAGTVDAEIADGVDPYLAKAMSPAHGVGTLRMDYTESMWLYYDIVNRDGEVERYMVYLERDDVRTP